MFYDRTAAGNEKCDPIRPGPEMAQCGPAWRMSMRELLEAKAKRLREEAFGLEHLARELQNLSPEAGEAFYLLASENL